MNYKNHNFKRDQDGRIIIDEFYDKVRKKLETRGKREKIWLIFDDVSVLFKKINEMTFEDYAELLAEALYNQIGIPSADYDLAIFRGENGVLSENFLEKGETLIPGNIFLLNCVKRFGKEKLGIEEINERSLNNVVTIQKAFQMMIPKKKKKKESIELYNRFGVHCMTLQGDIHWRNWSVIYNSQKDSSYRLAPLYDSAGMCRFSRGCNKLYGIYHGYAVMGNNTRARQYVEEAMFSEKNFDRESIMKYAPDSPAYMGVTKFMEAFRRNPIYFSPVAKKMLLLDPVEAIAWVENKIHSSVPPLVKNWFTLVIKRNIEFLAIDLANYYTNCTTIGSEEKPKGVKI